MVFSGATNIAILQLQRNSGVAKHWVGRMFNYWCSLTVNDEIVKKTWLQLRKEYYKVFKLVKLGLEEDDMTTRQGDFINCMKYLEE